MNDLLAKFRIEAILWWFGQRNDEHIAMALHGEIFGSWYAVYCHGARPRKRTQVVLDDCCSAQSTSGFDQ